jgi:hypothetical protein
MIDAYLAELERCLVGQVDTQIHIPDVMAMMRTAFNDAETSGTLDATFTHVGTAPEFAAKLISSGAGHRHCDPVVLPSGATVWAASFPVEGYARAGYARAQPPTFGLYLDTRWQPPWPHAHIDWPDFGLPANRDDMLAAFQDLLTRSQRGEVVEIGCIGGHGRTGTALGVLATLAGTRDDPVDWVRDTYCRHAIETDEQAAFVRQLRQATP